MNYSELLKKEYLEDDEETKKELRKAELNELKGIKLSNNQPKRVFFRASYNGMNSQILLDMDHFKKMGYEKYEAHLKPLLYIRLLKLNPALIKADVSYNYYKNNKKTTAKSLLK